MRGRVLVVDDDHGMTDLLSEALGRRGFSITAESAGDTALRRFREEDFDAVVSDLNMRGMNGLELCRRIIAIRSDAPVLLITAFGSLETAMQAIRAGAYDFVTKPVDLEHLALALDRAVQFHRLKNEVRRLSEAVRQLETPGELIGESEPMRALRDLIARVAPTEAGVLITGESGTGKELVARALHTQSRRSEGPFVAVNCAALPESLLESELFGHAKGAFTDARADRKGLFVQADGGTLFLDEIGEMAPSLQAKLLRALEQRTVRPIGSDREVPFDARIVAATNRDLERAIASGSFRDDLYFRLNVVQLDVPPLRARGGDVLILAHKFIGSGQSRGVKGLSPHAGQRLLEYPWPGNVRELRNCIERACAVARLDQINTDDFPDRVRLYSAPAAPAGDESSEALLPLAEIERQYVRRVLAATGGNRSAAAQILGIDRKTLARKIGDPADKPGDAGGLGGGR
jgi:DNA-binding NtrC family response regulator